MKYSILALVLCFATLGYSPSKAAESDQTKPHSVDIAVQRITSHMEEQGYSLEGIVDHGAAAESVGLKLLPTRVLFFGNREREAALIRHRRTVTLDLPVRFLVFEEQDGSVHIETNKVGYLVDRHEVSVFDPRLFALDQILDRFSSADSGIRTVTSQRSFKDTSKTLLRTLEARSFQIPLVIDYTDRRKNIRPTRLFVFGKPSGGVPLMREARTIGLDLPQKMLVYETESGEVLISYNDPFYMARKHNLNGLEPTLGDIGDALLSIATMVSEK